MTTGAYRVVQWATGNIGTHALRSVIAHPDMTLVGVYAHSDDKAGRDAGDLCGLPPTGVRATREVDQILALEPDCVLYMPARCDFPEVARTLESGPTWLKTSLVGHVIGAKILNSAAAGKAEVDGGGRRLGPA